jgi:hypothetical protein
MNFIPVTCERYQYGLTSESPEYDPTWTTFAEQENLMVDSRGQLRAIPEPRPQWHGVCSLMHQKCIVGQLEMECSASDEMPMILINVFYFNCAFADPIGSNLNKQKGSHNALLIEQGGRLINQCQTAAQRMSPILG